MHRHGLHSFEKIDSPCRLALDKSAESALASVMGFAAAKPGPHLAVRVNAKYMKVTARNLQYFSILQRLNNLKHTVIVSGRTSIHFVVDRASPCK
jgi:hypothetical protein